MQEVKLILNIVSFIINLGVVFVVFLIVRGMRKKQKRDQQFLESVIKEGETPPASVSMNLDRIRDQGYKYGVRDALHVLITFAQQKMKGQNDTEV